LFCLNLLYFQQAYLSTDWWLTAAASLDLLRRLETCAGERLVEKKTKKIFVICRICLAADIIPEPDPRYLVYGVTLTVFLVIFF
jgi:hypothetical protein